MTKRWSTAHRQLLIIAHGWTLLRGGVLRWRLETFGLYMPSLPNQRPWWRVNGRMLLVLFHHRKRYAHWVQEMDALGSGGAAQWWRAELGAQYSALQSYLADENRARDGMREEPEDSRED